MDSHGIWFAMSGRWTLGGAMESGCVCLREWTLGGVMLWFPMFKRMDIRGSHGALAKDEGWTVLEIMVGRLVKLSMMVE